MYTNGVTNNYSTSIPVAELKPAEKPAEKPVEKPVDKNENVSDKNDQAAVYEPTSAKKVTETAKKNSHAQNMAIVNQLKADMEKRQQQLQDIVSKMLNQQGNTWQTSQLGNGGIDIYKILQSDNLTADADTIAQAKADVAEDGYWGVNQTSDRFLSFAKALSGGDESKADLLMDAFKKGYEQASEIWGGELPELCQKTYDATIEKFEAWKNGTEE